MENKLKELREMLLDKDYPLGLDELLGQIEYIFEDDKEVSKVINVYIDDFYKMLSVVIWKDINGKNYSLAPSSAFKKNCRLVTSKRNAPVVWSLGDFFI